MTRRIPGVRLQWAWILPVIVLLAAGCDKNANKKPDPTKGAVAGIVICADTGKPARFATVNLTPVPVKHADPQDSSAARARCDDRYRS